MPKIRVFWQTEIDAIVHSIRAGPKNTISWADVFKEAMLILEFTPSRQVMSQRDAIANSHLHRALKHTTMRELGGKPYQKDIVDTLVMAYQENHGLSLGDATIIQSSDGQHA